jgi:hypothetical protein
MQTDITVIIRAQHTFISLWMCVGGKLKKERWDADVSVIPIVIYAAGRQPPAASVASPSLRPRRSFVPGRARRSVITINSPVSSTSRQPPRQSVVGVPRR